MKAQWNQYQRLNLSVYASRRTVIRKSHKMLSGEGKSRAQRTARHQWLRSMLDHHLDALDLALF